LVVSYDLWPGNAASLFSKEKVSKGVGKHGKKKKDKTGKQTIKTSKRYI